MRSSRRQIGRLGTAARVLLGLALLGPYMLLRAEPDALDLLVGLVGFPAIVAAWQWLRQRRWPGRLEATGPLAILLNLAIAIALFANDATRPAAAAFIGASLLVSALRGYAGCEVTAISNWLLRRDDQVGCVLLSPIDAVDPTGPRAARAPG